MSGILNSFVSGIQALGGGPIDSDVSMLATQEPRLGLSRPSDLYDFLKSLYYNDPEPYGSLDAGKWKGVEGYRNIVHAVCEFYVAVLFPGALAEAFPLDITPAQRQRGLDQRINDIWAMSNWAQRKQLYVRWAAMLGDVFLQAAVRRNSSDQPDGAFLEIVDPGYVTNFDTDERGYLTYIRVDIPRARRLSNGTVEKYLKTDEWNKFTGQFRRWESSHNTPDTPVDELQGLDEEASAPMEEFGIDFVPFTHAKFLDDGFPRGLSAAMMSLSKSREASRMATELHLKLFRYNQPDIQVVGTARNPDGYMYEPPKLVWDNPTTIDAAGYRRVAKMPAGFELRAIENRVNYEAHISAINAQMSHMQESDAPEMAWYQRNDSNESGRALRIKLTPAISRGVEVRGNLEAELIRANMMCLTLAQFNNVPGFGAGEIGTYEAGDFEHAFQERDIMPMTEEERADMMLKQAQTAEILFRIGISPEYINREVLRMTPEMLDQMRADRTPEQAASELIQQLDDTLAR